ERIDRWKTRSGTVKVNVAVDRLPDFTAKPGFDPEVHGGTIVLAESLDHVERAFQDAVAGRAATLPFADICIPSVFDHTLAPRSERIDRWKTRSGTVKVNVAVDRLPDFTAKPGFDPEVHGGTIVLAESLDHVERAFQDAVAGRAATLPFADICIPSVFDHTLAP